MLRSSHAASSSFTAGSSPKARGNLHDNRIESSTSGYATSELYEGVMSRYREPWTGHSMAMGVVIIR